MNNLDTSSSGVNLNLSCFYDTDLAREEFFNNFKRIDDQTFLFIDCGNVDQESYKVSKIINIVGYVQGEYAKIIVPTNLGFKRGFDFKNMLTNLFYRTPIYCRLEIDQEESYLDEGLEDYYTYNKDQIINYTIENLEHDKKDYIISWLTDNLPDQPDYN